MTRTTTRMKIVLAAAITMTGIAAATVRLGRARAEDGGNDHDAPKNGRAITESEVWSVTGMVVDEQGRPVQGALVQSQPTSLNPRGQVTAADGRFALPMGGNRLFILGLVAESGARERIGLLRFDDNPRQPGETAPVTIILKPSRSVRVRVKDGAGNPVAGAAVEAIELAYHTNATAGADGIASLRVAADAQIQWVTGLKGGSGFDYFENYQSVPAAVFPPLKEDIALTLHGSRTVLVKAVNSQGKPVPGVVVFPSRLPEPGKVQSADVGRGLTARVTTNEQGIAGFDWLPKDKRPFTFVVKSDEYFCTDDLHSRLDGPDELTAVMVRRSRASGKVSFGDGKPAGGILLRAQRSASWSANQGEYRSLAARTGPDGAYFFDLAPGGPHTLAVDDPTWAAPSRVNIAVQEGQARRGLDFTLTKGTLIRGTATEGPDHKPSSGATIALSELGTGSPREASLGASNGILLSRSVTTDGRGHYRFRVGPGRYSLRVLEPGGNAPPLMIEVKDQGEITHDIALEGSAQATYFNGTVVEETPTGDRPVGRSVVSRLRVGKSGTYTPSVADDQGRFRMFRAPGEWILYAHGSDKGLASFMPLPSGADEVRMVVSQGTRVTGRVVDTGGKPQAGRYVGVELDTGADFASSGHFAAAVRSDSQGRFTLSRVPVGSQGELSVSHRKDASSTSPRTVVKWEAPDLKQVEVPDLVVPPEQPAK